MSTRPAPAPLEADAFFVDELSDRHASGWLRPGGSAGIEVFLPGTGEILAAVQANQFKFGLSAPDGGRGGFFARFNRQVSAAERADIRVRRAGDGAMAHDCVGVTEYRPIMLWAMDIVDNCNLRCPFCVFDYSNTFRTNVMDDAVFEAALRFAPYVLDSNFWLSCLHEPALHPRFADYIAAVPADLRRKIFFTTNLAKPMPAGYFTALAQSGIATINVSLESLDPEIYERMRKGARHRIFMQNWDLLTAAFAAVPNPPFLRYIVMVYRSNLAEIPALTRHLVEERGAREVQLRFTFDVPHIPPEFRANEFVSDADWDWLAEQVRHYPPHLVQVIRPAPAEQVAQSALLPGRFECKVSADGTLRISRFWPVPFDPSGEPPVAVMNLKDIADPLRFLDSLPQ